MEGSAMVPKPIMIYMLPRS